MYLPVFLPRVDIFKLQWKITKFDKHFLHILKIPRCSCAALDTSQHLSDFEQLDRDKGHGHISIKHTAYWSVTKSVSQNLDPFHKGDRMCSLAKHHARTESQGQGHKVVSGDVILRCSTQGIGIHNEHLVSGTYQSYMQH